MRAAIVEAMEQFALAQEEQHAALRAGRSVDWIAWHDRRAKAFRALQQSLLSLDVQKNPAEREFAVAIQERLAGLLEGEQRLAEAVRERQAGLEKEQASIRRGKSTLVKMSVHRGGVTPPRFLSNRA